MPRPRPRPTDVFSQTFRWRRSLAAGVLNNNDNHYHNHNKDNNSPGQRPNGVLDLPETSSCVCVIVSRPRKVGRPRASSVESPFDATEAVLCQSLSRSWRPLICDRFCRRIQNTPLKCSESSSRSTSILETAFFEKVSNLKTFWIFWPLSMGPRHPVKME